MDLEPQQPLGRAADRIIVETDCPYLAPVPMRGRRCEPAHLPHIVDKLAEIGLRWDAEDRANRTTLKAAE